MVDKMEKIMKRIHVFFADCDTVAANPNMMIVPRKPILNLLEEMNKAVYEVMENYELTQTSRERELARHQKRCEDIIANANKEAEDLLAAPLLYADQVLIELQDLVDQTGIRLTKGYTMVADKLNSQMDELADHQREVRKNLTNATQSNKYLEIIKDYNDRIAALRKAETEGVKDSDGNKEGAEGLDGDSYDENEDVYEDAYEDDAMVEHSQATVLTHDMAAREKIINIPKRIIKAKNDLSTKDGKEQSEDAGSQQDEPEPDKVRLNEPRSEKVRPVKAQPKETKPREIRKVASVVDTSALSDEVPDDTVKRVAYEIKVNPTYLHATGELSPETLDAEYAQWQEGKLGDDDVLPDMPNDDAVVLKGFRKIFARKKNKNKK